MSRDLPAGKTCNDCSHAKRCVWYLGESFSYDSTKCDWNPSRFDDGPLPLVPMSRRKALP